MASTGFTDPRPVHVRATEQAAALIGSVRPADLARPTPCSAYDVRALLGHVVGGTLRLAVVGEGGDGLAVVPAVEGVEDDGWAAAYDEVRTRALKAWESDERMTTPARVPWGEVPGHAALSGYVMEIVTHTWDLAEGLGRPCELDPDLAGFALAIARAVLPDSRPRDVTSPDAADHKPPFHPRRPAPGNAGPYEELAAWLGREPLVRP
ncbi:TIGR03086 family metal-binding protein [Streptomyces sp. NPDC055966]|uniref:TIGR03086 family metal-binding protein n=1 Tax=Streptomyces sp. NPDC055966 TaxID=3345669 RepID=UPI0035D8C980